jgi:hypothetical protein
MKSPLTMGNFAQLIWSGVSRESREEGEAAATAPKVGTVAQRLFRRRAKRQATETNDQACHAFLSFRPR